MEVMSKDGTLRKNYRASFKVGERDDEKTGFVHGGKEIVGSQGVDGLGEGISIGISARGVDAGSSKVVQLPTSSFKSMETFKARTLNKHFV
ncbi:hypothetical protein GBA52_025836 [Prunus armeniaca]|nr:hypothetical protein GBA52_025836 [Prunus armeniaca]